VLVILQITNNLQNMTLLILMVAQRASIFNEKMGKKGGKRNAAKHEAMNNQT
jgi:hypothetical protein